MKPPRLKIFLNGMTANQNIQKRRKWPNYREVLQNGKLNRETILDSLQSLPQKENNKWMIMRQKQEIRKINFSFNQQIRNKLILIKKKLKEIFLNKIKENK